MNSSRAPAQDINTSPVNTLNAMSTHLIAKPQLAMAIGHDLRQLLCALNLYNESLSQEIKDPYCLQLMRHMDNAIAAMKTMLDSMLTVLRYDDAKLSPKLSCFSLADILDRLDAEFSPQAHAKGLQWSCDSNAAVMHTDSALLETVLRNLIGNALKYTQRGAVRVTCQRLSRRELAIAVSDTGIGIAPNQRELIFGEFYRVDGEATQQNAGLGLGLSIVQCICRHLDYCVFVESTLGQGSVFTLVCQTHSAQP